jgi:polyhydroxybutyrate depolymerase
MQVEPYRPGWQAPGTLERGTLVIAGVRRTYWLARAPRRAAPLLMVLHGSGMTGRVMARLTGLGVRGPAAGFTTVFPDGWKGAWHAARPPEKEPGLDDAAFLRLLTRTIESDGAARSWPVFLAGVSDGAWYAEHLARHGQLPVAVLFLVAGAALEWSRRMTPVPLLRATTVCIAGTGDPSVPYGGGPLTRGGGVQGWRLRRRATQHGERPGEDVVVSVHATAGDWAAGNGIAAGPGIEELPLQPGDPPVTRLSWTRPNCRPVTLYRIEGGGHGWPGGPQARPTRVIGPVARRLDATGILLDCAELEGAPAPGLDPRAIMRGGGGSD